ncbi:MAG: hypothetical protein ACOC0J_01255 [Myxococcota bacterium]
MVHDAAGAGGDLSCRDLLDEERASSSAVREGVTAGRCMWPLLPAGVRVVPADHLPRIGSVVIYRSGERLCAHRVVGLFDGGAFTRSDRPGAPIERVERREILGLWESGAGWRSLFLKPSVGAVVARLGLELSRPAPLRLMRRLAKALPALPPVALETSVLQGDGLKACLTLTRAGLTPAEASVEEVEAAYLTGSGGFAAVARCMGKPAGAAILRSRPGERGHPKAQAGAGILRVGVRRSFRRPEVFDALLEVVIDEAAARGFGRIEAEATAPGDDSGCLQAAALRRHGFAPGSKERRRLPCKDGRVVAYRRELS